MWSLSVGWAFSDTGPGSPCHNTWLGRSLFKEQGDQVTLLPTVQDALGSALDSGGCLSYVLSRVTCLMPVLGYVRAGPGTQ